MILKVQNINKSPIPLIYENVVQIDYIHYTENGLLSEYKNLSIVIVKDGVMYRQVINLTPDIQITILEEVNDNNV